MRSSLSRAGSGSGLRLPWTKMEPPNSAIIFLSTFLFLELRFQSQNFKWKARSSEHLIPCCGFRISFDGATLGWSGDTRFDPSHIDWLASSDVIVHETSESRVHTPIACLNALAPELRRKMRLIHMEDNFDQAVTDIVPLTEGEVLEVVGLDR